MADVIETETIGDCVLYRADCRDVLPLLLAVERQPDLFAPKKSEQQSLLTPKYDAPPPHSG